MVEKDDPPEPVTIRLSWQHQQQLERMRIEGGFRSRAALLQSLIGAILDDDAKAHSVSDGTDKRP